MRTCAAACPLVVTIALAISLPAIAGAQTRSDDQSILASGTKVRFELAEGGRREARVISLRRDTLRAIPRGGSEMAYPLASMRKLEAVNGRRRPILKGVLIGTGIGVVVGGVAGAASYKPCDSTESLGCILASQSRGEEAAAGAVVVGVAGLLLGGIVGLIPRDRWERVATDGTAVRVSARRLPHGAQGIGLAVVY